MTAPAPSKTTPRRIWLLLLILMVFITWLIVKQYLLPPPVVVLRECPHTWHFTGVGVSTDAGTSFAPLKLLAQTGSSGNDSILSGPGRNTNIPEFHDCQRFVVDRDGTAAYDSLYAIFAYEHLDTIFSSRSDTAGHEALPAARILSLSGEYPPLRIRSGFNCLYLKRGQQGWRAWMMSSFAIEVDCSTPTDIAVLESEGQPLRVEEVPGLERYGSSDFPAAARWDWDPKARQQVIGIRCGAGWCEVGSPDGFTTVRGAQVPRDLASAATGVARVYQIKGWYDEQELASVDNPLTPSGVRGTFIPDPVLDTFQDKGDIARDRRASPFYNHWSRVAEAYLDAENAGYRENFNLGLPTADGRASTFYLCFGEPGECKGADLGSAIPKSCKGVNATGPKWWLRIDAPDGRQIYRCVSRMGNPDGTTTPGTARWRWNLNDETTWVRCTNGCCQGGA